MYSELKNVQVIISLLKQYDICNMVLSPGTRNVPLVHSVEQDPFFKCYSMVDERSAAYFALGLAEISDQPICLSCTSSTATCNYFPAVVEARARGLKLIILTADRDNYLLKQGEDQLIPQDNMFGDFTIADVNLPIVQTERELKYCIRKCNEALIASTNRENPGPCQINFQINRIDLCRSSSLPTYRKVDVIYSDENEKMRSKKHELANYKKIMIILGQSYYEERDKIEYFLDVFFHKYNCMITYEETSNLHSQYFLKTCLIAESMTEREFSDYCPDLVITFGGHSFSFLKYKLRNNYKRITHWRVSNNRDYLDNYDALRSMFIMSEIEFLSFMNNFNGSNNFEYYNKWKIRLKEVKFPALGFSNYFVVKKFCEFVPDNSLVHLSILNSVRLFNFNSKGNTISFSNLGADGIDGCMPTFLGQADAYDGLAFLVIGDLSYFYGLNSSIIPHNKNIRILVINNHAGGEFHNNFGEEKIPTLRDYISAGHKSNVADSVDMTDFIYLSADNEDALDRALKMFCNISKQPIILEVFTDAEYESNVIKNFYDINQKLTLRETILKKGKIIARKGLHMLRKK